MNFELYKKASALAANVGGYWQARSWLDRNVYIMESPDIPGCRVEVAKYPEGDERYENDELELLHFEKRVEIFYGLLERGEPLPEYSDTCNCPEMKQRAQEQSPFYFIIKAEWKEAGVSLDEDGEVWEDRSGWLITSDIGDYQACDFEDELGRGLAMIGDHLWGHVDMLMEDGAWPPERREVQFTVTDADGTKQVLKGIVDG